MFTCFYNFWHNNIFRFHKNIILDISVRNYLWKQICIYSIYADALYLGKEHLPYDILAFVIVILFVFGVPFLLMISPWLKSNQFSRFATPITILQSIMEPFRSGLRSNCLCFLPYYYVCRMIIFAVGAFMQTEPIQYVILSLVCLLICVLFAMIQPYNNKNDNYVETILLANLTIVAVLSLGVEAVYKNEYREDFMYIVRALSYAHLAVFLFTIVWKTVTSIWIHYSYKRLIGGRFILFNRIVVAK